MYGWCLVQITMLVSLLTVRDIAGSNSTPFTSSKFYIQIQEYGRQSLNATRHIVSPLVDLIQRLQWRKIVIFYDQSTEEGELQAVLSKLDGDSQQLLTPTITLETRQSLWKNIHEHLDRVHELLFPKIYIISMCSDSNTSQLIAHVISADIQPGSLLDFRHNSFWLVLAREKWVDQVKNASSLLENVAIVPSDHTMRKTQVTLFESHCKVVCEDRYIAVAYGMDRARSWQWFGYRQIEYGSDKALLRLLYPNTVYGHNKRELRVTARTALSCSQINTKGQIYFGYCVDIFNDLMTTLNFSYKLIKSSKNSTYRSRATFEEMINEIQRGEADVCLTPATITEARSNVVDFSSPTLLFRHIVILYRKQNTKDFSLFRFLEPFRWEVYLTLLSAVVFISLAFFVTELVITGVAVHSISEVFFYFCSSIVQQGGRLSPITWTARALTSTFWLCSICLAASYSAYLTATFTVTNVHPFKDVRGLLQRKDYKVGINNLGASLTIIRNSKSGINKELWERIFADSQSDPSVIDGNETNQLVKVLRGNYAVVVGKGFAETAVSVDCRLEFLREEIMWSQGSFFVRKGSPYKHDIDKVMSRIVDSGTLKHDRGRYTDGIVQQTMVCEPESVTSVPKEYIVGILSWLLIGLVVSTIVLLVEVIVRKFQDILKRIYKRN